MSDSQPQYWLFKSEPNPRFENGIDVSYPIEKLEAEPNQTADWDGVRNAQASKFMREQMKIGDLGFFYHSNCKEPGVVGIVEVVRKGYPDETALDPKDPHYDPKATTDKPRWHKVDVKLVRRLKRLIPLAELKGLSALANMTLLTRPRLSVQPVSHEHWQIVLNRELVDAPPLANKVRARKSKNDRDNDSKAAKNNRNVSVSITKRRSSGKKRSNSEELTNAENCIVSANKSKKVPHSNSRS